MSAMKEFFAELDQKNIKYVHFKSNLSLDASFSGKGDFDVLVDRSRLSEVQSILISNGGKRFNTIPEKEYPGVENWLIFDPETDLIYHVHLHSQLATGKALLKDYVIPWSKCALESRIFSSEYGIYTTSPEFELALLLARFVLKMRLSVLIKLRFGIYKPQRSMEKERVDLLGKVDWPTFESLANKLFSYRTNDFVNIAKAEKLRSGNVRLLRKIVLKNLYYSNRLGASARSFIRSEKRVFSGKMHRHSKKNIVSKKTLASSGLIIAFTGVDGAGKSTLTKEIYEWLGKQISCFRFYMGSGDGKVPFDIKLIRRFTGSVKKTEDKDNQSKSQTSAAQKPGFKTRLKKRISAYTVLRIEKINRKKILEMNKLRMNGSVCLLDRYPQIEVPSCNDGPKIEGISSGLSNSHYYQKALKKEMKYLSVVKEVVPDCVFRINISAETSMSRKPEQNDINVYKDKISKISGITFQQANIIDIDGEQDYQAVVHQVKNIIWQYI